MKQTVLFFLLTLSTLSVAGNSTIEITDSWVRAAPPGVSMHAGYITVQNTGSKTVTLLKVTSPQFDSVQVHESFIENGMAHMRHVPELAIEAGETLHFAPGGYHLMLMQAHEPVKPGRDIVFMFCFSNGEKLRVTAPVQRAANKAQHHHQ